MVFIGTKLGETRENEQNQIKMNMLTNIVSDGNAKRATADERISGYEAADVRLVAGMLRQLVTEDGYIGPRVLPGGFVAEIQDGRVILPEEYQAFRTVVTAGTIKSGLKRGTMMSRAAASEMTGEEDDRNSGAEHAGEVSEDPHAVPGFLTFEEITENTVYISVMTESEYNTYLDRHSYNIHEALESADAAFGGITLAVQRQEKGLSLVWQIGMDGEEDPLSVLNLTEETLRARPSELTLDGQTYQCAWNEILARSTDRNELILVQLLPLISLREQNIKRALLVDLVMVLIFLTITIYVHSVLRYTTEHELTREQAERYRPERMRVRMTYVGLLSIIITFILAILIESVGQFYVEVRYGRDTLRIVSRQLETAEQDWEKSLAEKEEAWYTYYGEEMALLLTEYPELASRKTLQESCEALGLDYIMLFDSDGKLSCCNREFSGLDLTDEKNKELYDFHRLLYGMSGCISHDTSADGVTGLERHLVGVKIPARSTGMHGALLMALMPETVEKWSFASAGETQLTVASGTYCFAADSNTGEILYSSAAPLYGKTIRELQLPENSLRDGYMDLTVISGDKYLVVTSRDGDWVYYFGVKVGTMFGYVLQYGVLVSVLFGFVLVLLLTFLLEGYNEKAYQERRELYAQSNLRENVPCSDKAPERIETGLDRNKAGKPAELSECEIPEYSVQKQDTRKVAFRQQISVVLNKISSFVGWDRMLPKEKMFTVLRVGVIILLLCSLDVLRGKQLTNESYKTMLGFLLYGDWMRGPNLFGLCSTLLVIAFAYLFNRLSFLILNLNARLTAETGKTINRLLYSCIKYVTVFCVVYFGLGYLGFPTSTIIASLGAVSLALSLGAQSLIADILAGLAIVFDGSFQVGDVVKINGTRGTIEEIGVRNTKLRIPVDNILIINNHEIKDILNMSKRLSEYKLEIRLTSDQPLIPLEELLERELPLLGAKCSEIVEGPYLIGIDRLSDGGMMIKPVFVMVIGAMIQEKDNHQVKLFLNREIKLLFEREGLELM